MNDKKYMYLVFADDTTRFVDNSELEDCDVFKELVYVEFRRVKPIEGSLLRHNEPDDFVHIDEFVHHGFELYEAEQLIKELSKSNRWVNIKLEKHDIENLLWDKLNGGGSYAELREDRGPGEYGFETMILDSGLEVELTSMLKNYLCDTVLFEGDIVLGW